MELSVTVHLEGYRHFCNDVICEKEAKLLRWATHIGTIYELGTPEHIVPELE